MMRLINLLPWLPGHSGFGSYVQRVLPAIDGCRMQLDATGLIQLIPPENWLPNAPWHRKGTYDFFSVIPWFNMLLTFQKCYLSLEYFAMILNLYTLPSLIQFSHFQLFRNLLLAMILLHWFHLTVKRLGYVIVFGNPVIAELQLV